MTRLQRDESLRRLLPLFLLLHHGLAHAVRDLDGRAEHAAHRIDLLASGMLIHRHQCDQFGQYFKVCVYSCKAIFKGIKIFPISNDNSLAIFRRLFID